MKSRQTVKTAANILGQRHRIHLSLQVLTTDIHRNPPASGSQSPESVLKSIANHQFLMASPMTYQIPILAMISRMATLSRKFQNCRKRLTKSERTIQSSHGKNLRQCSSN